MMATETVAAPASAAAIGEIDTRARYAASYVEAIERLMFDGFETTGDVNDPAHDVQLIFAFVRAARAELGWIIAAGGAGAAA